MGFPEYSLGETGQLLPFLLVLLQVLGQKVTERAQCVSLEHQPLRLKQTLCKDGLEIPAGAQGKLSMKVVERLKTYTAF